MSKRFRVMAPLLVNYPPSDLEGMDLSRFISTPTSTEPEQSVNPHEFRSLLLLAKANNFKAIVVDVWWGVVQKDGVNGDYFWKYYDKLFADIIAANLKIVPGLAFHQCGGNVGDGNISIPLPRGALIALDSTDHPQDLRCKSEYSDSTGLNGIGSASIEAPRALMPDGCEESLSPWSTSIPEVQRRYYNFIQAFMRKYGHLAVGSAPKLKDIYIGLGPCGELRYPSYNIHDEISPNHPKRAGHPTRGAFQGYSDLAITNFRLFLRNKYHTNEALQSNWHNYEVTLDMASPPRHTEAFFARQDYKNSQFGKDLYDWYTKSLLQHAKVMFDIAKSARDAAGLSTLVDLHMKIPGVHWTQNGERIAEMNAGQIPSYGAFNESDDFGYRQLLQAIKNNIKPDGLSLTCLELDDENTLENDAKFSSIAKTLVYRFIQGCAKYGIKVDGENALGPKLCYSRSWQNMEEAMRYSAVRAISILRLQELPKILKDDAITVAEKASRISSYLEELHSEFNNGMDIMDSATPAFFQNGATPEVVLATNGLTAKPPKSIRPNVYTPPILRP